MTCRICWEESGPLEFPCACKDGVHASCLSSWRSRSGTKRCAACLELYDDVVNEAAQILVGILLACFYTYLPAIYHDMLTGKTGWVWCRGRWLCP